MENETTIPLMNWRCDDMKTGGCGEWYNRNDPSWEHTRIGPTSLIHWHKDDPKRKHPHHAHYIPVSVEDEKVTATAW